jgi:hypothetical protein
VCIFLRFLRFFFVCVHFLHLLLPPIVEVDISDIAIISVIPDGENYNIGDNQYSSKNLSYCPINRFLESVTLLTNKRHHHHDVEADVDEGGPRRPPPTAACVASSHQLQPPVSVGWSPACVASPRRGYPWVLVGLHVREDCLWELTH